MADTKRSVSDLQTLLADNAAGDISANDMRDVLVSCLGINGGIGIPTVSATSQAISGTTWTKVTMFVAEQSNGATGDHANDKITVDVSGNYMVTANFSMKSSINNVTFTFAVYKNGAITGLLSQRKVGTGADVGSASFGGMVSCSATDDLELYVYADLGTNLTLTVGQLTATMIG